MNNPHGNSNEMFGEQRPSGRAPARKDERGNDYRPAPVPQPFKIERSCDPKECKTHVTLTYSIEQDVIADPREALKAMFTGEQPATVRQWVPVLRVLSSYN